MIKTLSLPINWIFCVTRSISEIFHLITPRIVDPSKHIGLRITCSETDRKKAEWELL